MPNVAFSVYDLLSGRIVSTGHCQPKTLRFQADEGQGVVEAEADYAVHYVDTMLQIVRNRPAPSLSIDKQRIHADGVDEATISGIRPGSQIAVHFKGAQIADVTADQSGAYTVTSDEPGTFRVEIDGFPELPATIDIEAA